MDLRKAYEIVIEDILQNNNGAIDEEYIQDEDIEKLAKELIKSYEFLMKMTDVLEDVVNEYMEDNHDN